jgi:hypothetical protein
MIMSRLDHCHRGRGPRFRHKVATGQPVRVGMRGAWPYGRLERTLTAAPAVSSAGDQSSDTQRGFPGNMANPEMSQTGRTVPGMNEPLSRYTSP